MTVPGIGPVVALTYRAAVDVPARFRKSKSVGAVFGLTCAKYQSGEIDRSGAISRCGDEMMRTMVYEAAQSIAAKDLLDQLVGAGEQRCGQIEANDPGSGQVDQELELGGLLHRHFSGLRTLENARLA